MKALIILTLLLICGCDDPAYSEEITTEKAVSCILGESRGEGKIGIEAMAQALRNRGTVTGVFGCGADFSKELAYIKAKGLDVIARNAWLAGKNDLVHGADHWGGVQVDGKWIAKMRKSGFIQTAKIGNTVFYKGVKK